jgi:hypothetical protein
VRLVDHHCHGLAAAPPSRENFELLAADSAWPPPTEHSIFDSPIGLAIRHYCAPLLDLPANASAESYWGRRAELGDGDVARRLMGSTGIELFLVDTGFQSEDMLTPPQVAGITGARAGEIVRLEALAERVAAGASAEGFVDAFDSALASADTTARGYKSIMAYRYGLDFDPGAPARSEVVRAVGSWLAGSAGGARLRLTDPVVLRHILHRAVQLARPLQFHVGFGDADVTLYRCDPTRMTEFIRATRTSGVSIMLLHCYPFVQEAGFLAHVYPHVFLDTGAVMQYSGWRSDELVRQSFESAPFRKILFSSDAFGLPELYACGTAMWRRAMSRIFGEWLDEGLISLSDAQRYAGWMAAGNADRVYGQGAA